MKTEDFLRHEMNRRQFLGSSAANAAGMAAGMVTVGLAESAVRPAAGVAGTLRVAVIGVRRQGLELARTFAGLREVTVTHLCDVDESVLQAAAAAVEETQGRPPKKIRDFRRLLDDPAVDAVVLAVPDHWHAVMTVRACEAGKDVYVEAPLTHNFAEGQAVLRAVQHSGRIVQVGLQQRSGAHFRSAVEYLRSGKLGAVRLARAWCVHRRQPIGRKADAPAPARVDYDLWLGPAATRPFNPNRFHHNWRWYWDYGSGEIGQWGVHFLDVARWGLNVDWPERISSTGGIHYLKDDRETPDTQLVHYSYAGKTILWEHRMWSPHGLEGRSAACAFYGDNGTLIVDRGGWKVYGQKEAAAAGPSELLVRHCRHFVECVRNRQTPCADVLTGHIASGLCHLGNIAHRSGREIFFDPATQTIPADETAGRLLQRETYRSPWNLPLL